MESMSESENTPLLSSLYCVPSTTSTSSTVRANDMSSTVNKTVVRAKVNTIGLQTAAVEGPSTADGDVESVHDGDALDNAILRAQGHEASLPRVFSILSSLGLALSITNSWIGYLVS